MESVVASQTACLAAPMLARFKQLAPITGDDYAALLGALDIPRKVAAKCEINRSGAHSSGMHLIQQGYVYRFMGLPDGRQQITELLIPGDICDVGGAASPTAHHGFYTLTPVVYAEIGRQSLASLVDHHPCIGQALARAATLKEAMLYERIVSLGQRSALERLAHLFCEVFTRSRSVGLTSGLQCTLPMSQTNLADMLGLSLVHTNRCMMALRAGGLVRLDSRLLTIIDASGLQAAANFDPRYLDAACNEGKSTGATMRLMSAA